MSTMKFWYEDGGLKWVAYDSKLNRYYFDDVARPDLRIPQSIFWGQE